MTLVAQLPDVAIYQASASGGVLGRQRPCAYAAVVGLAALMGAANVSSALHDARDVILLNPAWARFRRRNGWYEASSRPSQAVCSACAVRAAA